MIGIGISNAIGFNRNNKDSIRIPTAIKNSMVLWYDIAKQEATNESMALSPILKDLSGNGNDATCYNFGWSGMSGIGGYLLNFTDSLQNSLNLVGVIAAVTANKVIVTDLTNLQYSYIPINNVQINGKEGDKVNIVISGDVASGDVVYVNEEDSNRIPIQEGNNLITIPHTKGNQIDIHLAGG